jgi:hypothetical protein
MMNLGESADSVSAALRRAHEARPMRVEPLAMAAHLFNAAGQYGHVRRTRFERTHVENASNVLAFDAHGCSRFAHESSDDIWAGQSIRQQEFDRAG